MGSSSFRRLEDVSDPNSYGDRERAPTNDIHHFPLNGYCFMEITSTFLSNFVVDSHYCLCLKKKLFP